MPRHGRIDYPGALHHVIIRGINRAAIFKDNVDRRDFLFRLEKGLEKTGLICYAWALIPNHVHILLRTGSQSLTSLMRSLLSGYALSYNRRHGRVGYLFQNRYKSILCDDKRYFLQLVRYIHLNPLRASLVQDLWSLNSFPWSGHSTIMGKYDEGWQNTQTILRYFGANIRESRENYFNFVRKGIVEGRRKDLTGGGLLRSYGGWDSILNQRKGGERWRGDERILGDSEFVKFALAKAEEKLTRRLEKKNAGWNLSSLLKYIGKLFQIEKKRIRSRRRDKEVSTARAVFIWLAIEELGYSGTEVAIFLRVTPQAVSQSLHKGRMIVEERGIELSQIN
ncbi:MAG: transposase [Candidatus Auribacterota bacterium]|nr:transposase [Candidatus Auribacterota bacterium]